MLLAERLGGFWNLTGVRFQLHYGLLQAFQLYVGDSTRYVRFEGLEDVDVGRIDAGDLHIQVKTSSENQGWSWAKEKKVFDHFIEVYRTDPNGRFRLVTNFAFTEPLACAVQFSTGQLSELPDECARHVDEIAERCDLPKEDIGPFLRAISYERLTESEILERLTPKLVAAYQLSAGKESLYISHLVGRALTWSVERATLERTTLEAERLRVSEWISLGAENPAIRDRLITTVTLRREQDTSDYYEGKQARPNEQDRAQVEELARQVQEVTGDNVQIAYVDAGYTGEQAAEAAEGEGIRLEVVKLPDAKRGFVLLPRRWVVERSFAWATRFRRLARDYERLPETLAGLHFVAFAMLLAARFVQLVQFLNPPACGCS
jgi:transposase